jgi:hypothetical protein
VVSRQRAGPRDFSTQTACGSTPGRQGYRPQGSAETGCVVLHRGNSKRPGPAPRNSGFVWDTSRQDSEQSPPGPRADDLGGSQQHRPGLRAPLSAWSTCSGPRGDLAPQWGRGRMLSAAVSGGVRGSRLRGGLKNRRLLAGRPAGPSSPPNFSWGLTHARRFVPGSSRWQSRRTARPVVRPLE